MKDFYGNFAQKFIDTGKVKSRASNAAFNKNFSLYTVGGDYNLIKQHSLLYGIFRPNDNRPKLRLAYRSER